MNTATAIGALLTLAVAQASSAPLDKDFEHGKQIGAWTLYVDEDLLTDTDRVAAFNRPVEGYGAGGTAEVGIAWHCAFGRADLMIIWDEYLGLERVDFRWRLDDGEARRGRYLVLNTGTAATHSGKLKRQVLDANRLVLAITPYREGTDQSVFDLDGTTEVYEQMAALCERRR